MFCREKASTQSSDANAIVHESLRAAVSKGMEPSYMDFPILRDENTISYVQRNKLMVIVKGLPGSGKSTIANNIKKIYPDAVVCSADNFFFVDKFDSEKLKYAHESCQKEARNAARRNTHVIVIDNTNVDSAVYLQMCKKYKYLVLYIEPQTPWCFDAAVKNSHEDILAKKVKSYQPIYYAWFFNESDSERIKKIAWQWLEKALLEVDDFLQEFLQLTELDSIREYFENKNPHLHVTAMFTNRGKLPGAVDYINDPLVKQSMGKCYPISIIGYVITPYTFGARIQLTKEELELWGQEDRPDNGNPSGDIITNQNRFCPRGSRAHITLGTAPGVKPVTTGFDLIDVITCEQRMDNVPTYSFSGAVLKCYGEGKWVIYPETKVVAESFFSAYY